MISDFTRENAFSSLKELLDSQEVYSVGVHKSGITRGVYKGSEDSFSESFLKNGIVSDSIVHFGLVGTVSMLGSTDFEKKIDESVADLLEFVDREGCSGAVIVAIPGSIEGLDGGDYFLGTYPDDVSAWARRDDRRLECLPVEEIGRKMGTVPKEFILGVIEKSNGETHCYPNYGFISNLSDEEKKDFFQRINSINTLETLEKYSSETKYKGTFWEDFYRDDEMISHDYLIDSVKKYLDDRKNRGYEISGKKTLK